MAGREEGVWILLLSEVTLFERLNSFVASRS